MRMKRGKRGRRGFILQKHWYKLAVAAAAKGKSYYQIRTAYPRLSEHSLLKLKVYMGIPKGGHSQRVIQRGVICRALVASGYRVNEIAKMYGITRFSVMYCMKTSPKS